MSTWIGHRLAAAALVALAGALGAPAARAQHLTRFAEVESQGGSESKKRGARAKARSQSESQSDESQSKS